MAQITDFNPKYHAAIRAQLAAAPVVGRRAGQSPESVRGSEGQAQRVETPADGVGYRVSLIQVRRRLLDAHDSLPFSVKPTVDEITRFLGFASDADPRLHWEFCQTVTEGGEGLIVRIEVL